MLTKQEVRNEIYSGLCKVLAEYEFRLNKGQARFLRAIPSGKQGIFVSLADYKPEYVFSFTMSIRLDSVEQIFSKFSGASPKGTASDTSYIQLEYFTSLRPAEFKVTTVEQIQRALSSFEVLLHDKIIPFLDCHQDLKSLDDIMNKQDNVDTMIHPYRGMHAIILAKLTGNQNLNALVTRYQEEMRLLPPDFRGKFDKVVEYLAHSTS